MNVRPGFASSLDEACPDSGRDGSPSGAEPPTDAVKPGTSPLVAAFDVGRLSNEFRFEMIQAWFEQDATSHRRSATVAAGRLGRRARVLKPTAEARETIQREVMESCKFLLAEIDEGWYEDSLEWILSGINIVDVDLYWEHLCNDHLKPVTWKLAGLRERFMTDLDDRHRLALHLGEVVDQGLRPSELLGHIIEWRVDPKRRLGTGDHGEPPYYSLRRPIAGEGVPVPRFVLRESGEIPPAPDWFAEVEQRAIELNIAHGLPSGFVRRLKATEGQCNTSDPGGDCSAIVNELDMAIRATLEIQSVGSDCLIGGKRAVEGRPQGRSRQVSLIPAGSPFPGGISQVAEDQDCPEVDHRAVPHRAPAVDREAGHEPPSPGSTGCHPAQSDRVRKARIPWAEAKIKVSEYIEKNPDAKIREIVRETGVSQGAVQKTLAWRELMEDRRKTRRSRSVRTRSLPEEMVPNLVSREIDPIEGAMAREQCEEAVLKDETPEDRAAYYELTRDEQDDYLSSRYAGEEDRPALARRVRSRKRR